MSEDRANTETDELPNGEAARRASDCYSEINRGLSSWWKDKEDLAKEIAEEVISFATGDCYIDEVGIQDSDGGASTVRVLVLGGLHSRESDLKHATERLESIFGTPVDLWCCGTLRHLYGPAYPKDLIEE